MPTYGERLLQVQLKRFADLTLPECPLGLLAMPVDKLKKFLVAVASVKWAMAH
jgi:hypothetical protein